jgi:hypothetical protein
MSPSRSAKGAIPPRAPEGGASRFEILLGTATAESLGSLGKGNETTNERRGSRSP